MARFTSKKYRELVVKFSNRSRVKFTKGEVEVSGDDAERLLAFAERHPDYEIEQVESDEKPLTPKQKAVAAAEERGLDTSGTQREIEARVAAFDAADDPDTDDDADENPDEDDETEDETDEDADSDSSDEDTSDDA